MALHERLQHRRDEDLPPLPAELVRGAPESLLSPVIVLPVEVAPTTAPVTPVAQQVERVAEQIREQAGELAPGSTDVPGMEWVREWRPTR